MNLTHSNEYPTTKKIQGVYQVPVGIETITDEEGNVSYKYAIYKFDKYVHDMEYQAKKQYAKDLYAIEVAKGCPITYPATRIDCKENNVSDFVGTLSTASVCGFPDDTEIIIRDYYNDNHTITLAEYKTLCSEMYIYLANLRKTYWANIDNMEGVI